MTTDASLIHKDADGDYGVSFPDLPGCIAAGTTLDQTPLSASVQAFRHRCSTTSTGTSNDMA